MANGASRRCNLNCLWAWVMAETLVRLGLKKVVISPGSRSGPLTVAMAEHPELEVIPVLDERSASFLALGMAQVTLQPVVLICTSGTAAANYYPAIIEASLSHLPLLVLTADRPPELRDCHAGQAMDQVKLYGHYPRWQMELATPSLEINQLAYLRQTLIQAWSISLNPNPGPVHLNVPLRDPLAPEPDQLTAAFYETVDWPSFFAHVAPPIISQLLPSHIPWPAWLGVERGVIIAGPVHSANPKTDAEAVANLSQVLGWPILADALSPVRHYLGPGYGVIATYDLILRDSGLAASLAPELVIQLGPLPTSKALRAWLQATSPRRWIITPFPDNADPLHGPSQTIRTPIEALVQCEPSKYISKNKSDYFQAWQQLEREYEHHLANLFEPVDWLCEPKLAWLLAQHLPPEIAIFVASSMPVRDVESVWPVNQNRFKFYFNRGVNGIDGTLSTALGVAWEQPTVLMTGDLALLHDTNGFLIKPQFPGQLTIVLINNQGGGIFGHLPIRAATHVFEPYFATPQAVDFANLAVTYGLDYDQVGAWDDLLALLHTPPRPGIYLIELATDRLRDAQWRTLTAFRNL